MKGGDTSVLQRGRKPCAPQPLHLIALAQVRSHQGQFPETQGMLRKAPFSYQQKKILSVFWKQTSLPSLRRARCLHTQLSSSALQSLRQMNSLYCPFPILTSLQRWVFQKQKVSELLHSKTKTAPVDPFGYLLLKCVVRKITTKTTKFSSLQS